MPAAKLHTTFLSQWQVVTARASIYKSRKFAVYYLKWSSRHRSSTPVRVVIRVMADSQLTSIAHKRRTCTSEHNNLFGSVQHIFTEIMIKRSQLFQFSSFVFSYWAFSFQTTSCWLQKHRTFPHVPSKETWELLSIRKTHWTKHF